jgi:hypothetical protein
LQALLHVGELRIAKTSPEATVFASEHQSFHATISEAGNAKFGARVGRHDHLVLALACRVRFAARRPGTEVSIPYEVFA